MEHRKGEEKAWRAASLGQGVGWVRDGMRHLLLSQLIKLPPDSASQNLEGEGREGRSRRRPHRQRAKTVSFGAKVTGFKP